MSRQLFPLDPFSGLNNQFERQHLAAFKKVKRAGFVLFGLYILGSCLALGLAGTLVWALIKFLGRH